MKHSDHVANEWFEEFQNFINADQKWKFLQNLIPVSGDAMRDSTFRRDVHSKGVDLVQSQLSDQLRDYFLHAFQSFVKESLKIPFSQTLNDAALNDLVENGFTNIQTLDQKNCDILEQYLRSKPIFQGNTEQELKEVSYEDAPNYNMARYLIEDIIESADILYQATSPEFLNLAEGFLGYPPVIGNISSWHSFGGHNTAINAQQFHLDLDDYRFCKGFIYLTDVSETTGPHCYFPKSHRFDEIFDRSNAGPYSKEEFLNWYKYQLRKSDESCIKFLGREPVNITGNRGTCLMVDTSGVHKGLLPIDGNRLLLQFEYCATPTATRIVELLPFSKLIDGREDLRKHFEQANVQYALQLLIDFNN